MSEASARAKMRLFSVIRLFHNCHG